MKNTYLQFTRILWKTCRIKRHLCRKWSYMFMVHVYFYNSWSWKFGHPGFVILIDEFCQNEDLMYSSMILCLLFLVRDYNTKSGLWCFVAHYWYCRSIGKVILLLLQSFKVLPMKQKSIYWFLIKIYHWTKKIQKKNEKQKNCKGNNL